MKIKFGYVIYLFVFTVVFLEISIRLLSKPNPANVELFLNKNHRYLLPLPILEDVERDSLKNQVNTYRVFDRLLGWSQAKWGIDTSNKEYKLFSNDMGFRVCEEEYRKRIPAKDKYDIVTIGGSFTHANSVNYENSWPYYLGENLNNDIANLGVEGYGIQQAILRFINSKIKTDTVILDGTYGSIDRIFEPVYTFYQGGNKTKPIIKFSDTLFDYSLINVPVLSPNEFEQSKKDHTHEIFNHIPGYSELVFSDAIWTKSYILRLIVSINHQRKNRAIPRFYSSEQNLSYTIKMFELFGYHCRQKGIYPILLLLDQRSNIEGSRDSSHWKRLREGLRNSNIEVIDFHDELASEHTSGEAPIFSAHDNLHYSPYGNKFLAELLTKKLKNSQGK